MEIGYKVVGIMKTGKLISLAAPSDGLVFYELGKETIPRKDCGPLILWATEEEARDSVGSSGRDTCRLFRCAYEPSHGKRPGTPLCPMTLIIPEYWVLAEEITLLEELPS